MHDPSPNIPPGARYAGPVLNEAGHPQHHLILLQARPETDLNWQDAQAWATSVGGELPSPQEQALLFANCRDALPETWCWSNKEHEKDASYAWDCYFGNGYQNDGRKSYEGSAVAVRRLALESFNPSDSTCADACTHPSADPTIKALRKRLERWELGHLRKHAQELAARLDAAQERIEALETDASRAWDAADSWREDATALAADLEKAGLTVGLTPGGQLVAIDQQGDAA